MWQTLDYILSEDGKVALLAFPNLPAPLLALLEGTTEEAKHYHNFLRAYNSAFNFTSNANSRWRLSSDLKCFAVPLGQAPYFAQIYDTDCQIDRRSSIFPDLHRNILEKIHNALAVANPFVCRFQANNKEALHYASTQEFELRVSEPSIRNCRYNQPTGSEVAVLMPGDRKKGDGRQNIVLRKRGGGLRFVSELDVKYDPLHFVLPFPYGSLGWSLQLKERSKELLHLSIDKEIFDKVKGRVYVVEFKKHVLSHAHVLWILDDLHMPKTPKDIDKIVCAELPDPNDKVLFDCVMTQMIHGPCGSENPRCPCMKDKKCSKKFPKEFIGSTQVNHDGYPLYQRHNDSYVIHKGLHLIDNSWVVPYNKFLCKVSNCHINMEICSSIQSVKYQYKYVYKGHDRIQARVASKDAPSDGVVVGAAQEPSSRGEAQHMQQMYPRVYALQVHNENMQSVVYAEDESVSDIMDRSACTSLTEWMRYNREHPKDKVTKRTLYYTYQRAAQARGLLKFDEEFNNDITLALGVASLRQVCEPFAMLLLYCDISRPCVLLEKYLDAMSKDICFTNGAL
ncbi:uncharacterized protein LOC144712654 [Wolffia australiana]